jgi:XTP/dITP diphosphohydrolase
MSKALLNKDIVLASGNKGKIREFNQRLGALGFHIRPQSEFDTPEAEENGLSFVENAIIKARQAAKHTGLPAIADDSGLEVDALNGAPGIYSARYSGDNATDASNNEKLLDALKDLPQDQRNARFQCVLVYMRHHLDPTPLVCQASWEGQIVPPSQGSNGFGYDPLFFVRDENCTAAELTPERKNSISHRGQAMDKLIQALSEQA